MLKANDIKR